jgi:hypothetical protein
MWTYNAVGGAAVVVVTGAGWGVGVDADRADVVLAVIAPGTPTPASR